MSSGSGTPPRPPAGHAAPAWGAASQCQSRHHPTRQLYSDSWLTASRDRRRHPASRPSSVRRWPRRRRVAARRAAVASLRCCCRRHYRREPQGAQLPLNRVRVVARLDLGRGELALLVHVLARVGVLERLLLLGGVAHLRALARARHHSAHRRALGRAVLERRVGAHDDRPRRPQAAPAHEPAHEQVEPHEPEEDRHRRKARGDALGGVVGLRLQLDAVPG